MCYYFDDTIRAKNRDIYSSDNLLDENLCNENHKNILIYDVLYKVQRVQNHCALCLIK